MIEELTAFRQSAFEAVLELAEIAKLQQDQILVVGCSTSEVQGEKIGSGGSIEVAQAIFFGLSEAAQKVNLSLAFQCCEHLNRALVVDEATMKKYQLEEVAVVPHPHAGGALASIAYRQIKSPAIVESIQAHAGLDIGNTLIGMHLKRVAVPVRLAVKYIGKATVIAARTRPKLIGGERAQYCI